MNVDNMSFIEMFKEYERIVKSLNDICNYWKDRVKELEEKNG
jgi:hypothetical protein